MKHITRYNNGYIPLDRKPLDRKLFYRKQFKIPLKPYLTLPLTLTGYRQQCSEVFTSPSNIVLLALGIFAFGLMGFGLMGAPQYVPRIPKTITGVER